MSKKLSSRGVAAHVRREDWARRFAPRNGRTDSLINVAEDAVRLCSAGARDFWSTRLGGMSAKDLRGAVDIQALSPVARTFAVEVVLAQRSRLLRCFQDA